MEYENIYTDKKGYKYTQKTSFCSKSCKTRFQRNSLTKEKLESEIIDYVIRENKYCTMHEILIGINRSSKTITNLCVKIKDLQSKIGFIKPKSLFQNKVHTALLGIFDDIECEKIFSDLISPKGYELRVDFFIKSLKLIIEADGNQHSDVVHPWFSRYNEQCDIIKNQYAIKNGLRLIRIPYSKKVDIKYINQFLSCLI
jgi:hypothetical protein